MGCNQSQAIEKHLSIQINHQALPPVETRVIRVSQRENVKTDQEAKPEQVRRKEDKVKFLQENKGFISMSIETNMQVNQALKSLSRNPILQDDFYTKLINTNQKCLEQKQNRYKNLQMREEKAEIELEKQLHKKKYSSHPPSKSDYLKSKMEAISQMSNTKQTKNAVNAKKIAISRQLSLNPDLYMNKFMERVDKVQVEVNNLQSKKDIVSFQSE